MEVVKDVVLLGVLEGLILAIFAIGVDLPRNGKRWRASDWVYLVLIYVGFTALMLWRRLDFNGGVLDVMSYALMAMPVIALIVTYVVRKKQEKGNKVNDE